MNTNSNDILNWIDELYQKNQKLSYFLLALIAMPFLTGGVLVWLLNLYGNQLPNFSIPNWIMLYFVISLFMSFGVLPNTLIAGVGGYYLGFYSLLYLSPAYMLAACIGYFLGVLINNYNTTLKALLLDHPQSSGVIEKMQNKQLTTVIFAKISPVLPFVMMNALFGLFKFNFAKFFIGSWLGKLPRLLLFTFLGTNVKSLVEFAGKSFGRQFWVYGILLALTLLSFAGIYYFVIKPNKNISK